MNTAHGVFSNSPLIYASKDHQIGAQFAKFSIRDSFEKNSRQVFKKSLGKKGNRFLPKYL